MEAVRQRIGTAMASAATVLLAALDDRQRAAAAWPFPSDDERRRWFYTPTNHGGLPLSSMAPHQQQLVFKLVASVLSRPGYVTVSTIIGLDNVLDELEGWWASWDRDRGRDPGLYYVRIFGDPATESRWSWRFGGHHVSLHFTVIQGEVASVTPCFLGADPASSPLLGPHPLRPLAGAEDYARELLHALNQDQRAAALVSEVSPVDLVGGNRSLLVEGNEPLSLVDIWRGRFDDQLHDRLIATQASMEASVGLQPHHLAAVRFTKAPKGISVSQLDGSQQGLLRRLLDVYLGRMSDDFAALEAAKYAGSNIESLSFLWAGGLETGQPHYYRIQGPRLVIEYDNAARNANHVHSVWRDPEGDFAVDVLADHYRDAH